MSYPQPNSNDYALNGYKYFRLNTLLSSPGDIYESAQSGHALAIGPESDISKVNVAYFDDQVPTYMQMTTIGEDRGFVGRIDARNEVTYQPAGRPGRLLFWSADLYDSTFRPPGFSVITDLFLPIAPRLDVIQYFDQQPSLSPKRNDKTYNLSMLPTPTAVLGSVYAVIPFWGRRYAMLQVTNKSTGPFSFAASGINYAIASAASASTQITPIVALAPLAVGGPYTTLITSTVNGMFDALLLQFKRLAIPDLVEGVFRITVSDRQA